MKILYFFELERSTDRDEGFLELKEAEANGQHKPTETPRSWRKQGSSRIESAETRDHVPGGSRDLLV